MSHIKNHQAGIGLVEVLLAVALIGMTASVLLMSMMYIHTSSKQEQWGERSREIAYTVMQAYQDQAKSGTVVVYDRTIQLDALTQVTSFDTQDVRVKITPLSIPTTESIVVAGKTYPLQQYFRKIRVSVWHSSMKENAAFQLEQYIEFK